MCACADILYSWTSVHVQYVSVTSTDFVCTVWPLCVRWGKLARSLGILRQTECIWAATAGISPPNCSYQQHRRQLNTLVQSQSADGAVNTQSHVSWDFQEMAWWKKSKTRNFSGRLSWLNAIFSWTNFHGELNRICSIFPTDWRDAPECVRLHPHRRPSGVQTPAPLGHVSSTAPGDVSAPGQPASCRDWWVASLERRS